MNVWHLWLSVFVHIEYTFGNVLICDFLSNVPMRLVSRLLFYTLLALMHFLLGSIREYTCYFHLSQCVLGIVHWGRNFYFYFPWIMPIGGEMSFFKPFCYAWHLYDKMLNGGEIGGNQCVFINLRMYVWDRERDWEWWDMEHVVEHDGKHCILLRIPYLRVD